MAGAVHTCRGAVTEQMQEIPWSNRTRRAYAAGDPRNDMVAGQVEGLCFRLDRRGDITAVNRASGLSAMELLPQRRRSDQGRHQQNSASLSVYP